MNTLAGGANAANLNNMVTMSAGFLTAVLQNHARLTQTPIDQLSFGFKVLPVEQAQELTAAPKTGVCVSGLHLEGARCACLTLMPLQLHCMCVATIAIASTDHNILTTSLAAPTWHLSLAWWSGSEHSRV